MNKKQLREDLEDLTLSNNYSGPRGLREIALLAGLKDTKYAKKPAVIDALIEYYTQPGALSGLWDKLTPGEQALAALYALAEENMEPDDILEIVKAYGLTRKKSAYYFYYGIHHYFDTDSVFWVLFPGGNISKAIVAEIKSFAAPFFLKQEQADTEGLLLIDREDRSDDFGKLVRFCNRYKCAATKGGLMTKKSILEFVRFAGYSDLTDLLSPELNNVQSMQKLRVSLPLYLAALSGGLLQIEGDAVRPGGAAVRLLRLSEQRLIRELFDAYLSDKRLQEIDYISGIRQCRRVIHWNKARCAVIEELKKFPVGEYWSVACFSRILRITRRGFLRSRDPDIAFTGNSSSYVGWKYAEQPVIDLVLSVLGALGILEIGWEFWEEQDDYGNVAGYSRPAAFRITELGAWVLGLRKTYTPPKPEAPKISGGFLVQPDFCVMVPESVDRLRHELFFERFLTRVSSDPMMAVYRLDFESMLKALELGISIGEIRGYLTQGADKPVPENILRALDDWQTQSQRIKIRTVTLLETDDPVLLEEILHYKGMEQLAEERIQAAAVIDQQNAPKIKKLLEKNKRFCKNEF